MLSTPGSSSPSQEGREMSHSPQAPAQGLTVQLEQGVATLEADFRQEMHRKLALRNFLLTLLPGWGLCPAAHKAGLWVGCREPPLWLAAPPCCPPWSTLAPWSVVGYTALQQKARYPGLAGPGCGFSTCTSCTWL